MIEYIGKNTESGIFGSLRQEERALGEAGSGAALNALAARESAGERAQQKGDTVAISEEARTLSEASGDEGSGAEGLSAPRRARASDEESGTDLVKEIRKQIQEVKKELQEARLHLAEAQAAAGASETQSGKASSEAQAVAGASETQSGKDPSEAAMKAAMQALSGNPEVEAAQMKVDMLNQRLLMLNDRLREAMSGAGGSGGAAGSAGLGGIGASGGLGERIEATV